MQSPRRLLTILLPGILGITAGAGVLSAQEAMPTFFRVDYMPSRRDPGLDPSARSTLISGQTTNSREIAAGDVLTQFLEPILAEMRKRLVVTGVMIEKAKGGSALISNVEFTTGDTVLLPVPPDVAKRVLATANTYGLPVKYRPGKAEGEAFLVLVVSEITPRGVKLKLPGFRNALPILPYDPDTRPESESFGQ